MNRFQVIRHKLAYVDENVDLCGKCVEGYEHPLGPVVWSWHDGVCESCLRATPVDTPIGDLAG